MAVVILVRTAFSELVRTAFSEDLGRRSRQIGGLPPVPPRVGDSLPYNPRKVVRV